MSVPVAVPEAGADAAAASAAAVAGGGAATVLAGHQALLALEDDRPAGYAVMSIAAGEAHVLNLCTAPERQSRGLGRHLLRALLKTARDHRVQRVFLEVRPSNPQAIALYHSEGFNEIGRRPRSYPAATGREDALVMALELLDDAPP